MAFAKKILATLLFTAVQTSATFAQNAANQDVNTIQLTYGIVIPTDVSKTAPRIPAANVRVYNQAHTLFLYGAFSGYTLQIMDCGENVVSQKELFGEDFVELPEYLSGQYIVRFLSGNHFFEGYIEL